MRKESNGREKPRFTVPNGVRFSKTLEKASSMDIFQLERGKAQTGCDRAAAQVQA
jgi:hypothetical protein